MVLLRIGIVTDAIDDKAGGIGTYVRNLVLELARSNDGHDYFLIHHSRLVDDEIYTLGLGEIVVPIPKVSFGRELRKLFLLPSKADEFHLDVVHETSQMNIYFFPTKFKKVVTIHDLIPLLLPETSTSLITFHHRYGMRFSLRSSDAVICVSKNTKKDLFRFFSRCIGAEAVYTIYEGRDKNFRRETDHKKLRAVKNKYQLPEDYLLSVATLSPRKNLERVLKAFANFKHSRQGKDYSLVFVGSSWGSAGIQLRLLATELGVRENVIFTGWVEDDELPALYSMARACIFTTLYEGFGFPVLEAQSVGVPVVVSNNSSIPEVAGRGAVYVNPYKVTDIAWGMKEATTPCVVDDLLPLGLKNARRFSWKRCADETRKVYESLR